MSESEQVPFTKEVQVLAQHKDVDDLTEQEIDQLSRVIGEVMASAMADFIGKLQPLMASLEHGAISEDAFDQELASLLTDKSFIENCLQGIPMMQEARDGIISEFQSAVMQMLAMPVDQLPDPEKQFEDLVAQHPALEQHFDSTINSPADPASAEYLKGIEDGIAMAVSMGFTHAAAEAKLRKGFATKPIPARLSNAPQVQAMMSLLSNYDRQDRFKIHPDYGIAVYQSGKNGKAILQCDQIALDCLKTEQEKIDFIWELIRQFSGLSRDDGLIAAYAIYRLLQSPDGVAKIGFLELLKQEGKEKLDRDGRMQQAKRYHRLFQVIHTWVADVNVEMKDYETGKIIQGQNLAPLYFYQGMIHERGQGILDGMDACPVGFIILDSTLTKVYRQYPALLLEFGALNQLGQIPSGKPGGDWAKSIGLAAAQAIRNDAKHGGATKRLTRRYLLSQHPTKISFEELLNSSNPDRAREYFNDAVGILQEQNIFASCIQPDPPLQLNKKGEWVPIRKGWKDKWPDEVVEITLAGEWAVAPQQVLDRTTDRKAKQARKQNKPTK